MDTVTKEASDKMFAIGYVDSDKVLLSKHVSMLSNEDYISSLNCAQHFDFDRRIGTPLSFCVVQRWLRCRACCCAREAWCEFVVARGYLC